MDFDHPACLRLVWTVVRLVTAQWSDQLLAAGYLTAAVWAVRTKDNDCASTGP
ncbi:MAG TPA: hypothetical protein VGP26_22770 [Actinophytocola sp.]|nr:hypothetical protein [Actinophytocola sp.]